MLPWSRCPSCPARFLSLLQALRAAHWMASSCRHADGHFVKTLSLQGLCRRMSVGMMVFLRSYAAICRDLSPEDSGSTAKHELLAGPSSLGDMDPMGTRLVGPEPLDEDGAG